MREDLQSRRWEFQDEMAAFHRGVALRKLELAAEADELGFYRLSDSLKLEADIAQGNAKSYADDDYWEEQ